MEDLNLITEPSTNTKKTHNIPLEHLDFKYIEKCSDVKELEKIYRVLASGVEGKYPELENFVYEKIKSLSPNSRVLRKDIPISSKSALSKNEQTLLDNEIEDFVKQIPNLEKKVVKSHDDFDNNNENFPPVRSAMHKVVINSTKTEKTDVAPSKPITNVTSSKKSVKPKDYREWEKIEKKLEKELEENEQVKEVSAKKEEVLKVSNDKTTINHGKNFSKALVKDLLNDINTEKMDETTKTLKADQEKCKGNEAFAAGCYQEAASYYTRSLKYFPNAASYNNRALAYIKLEEWDKAIEDCSEVLKYEKDNIKALLRRGTAFYKKKNYNKANEDIKKCLKLDPNDKKAKELEKSIEKDSQKDREEKEKIKSIGGNRLKIEETDGSDEESEEEVKVKQEPIKQTSQQETQKKQIKIAEVESDETDESDTETHSLTSKSSKPCTTESPQQDIPKEVIEKNVEVQSKENLIQEPTSQIKVESKNEPELPETKETKVEPVAPKPFKLPDLVAQAKDKGNSLFASGQYGEAIEQYTKAIEKLKSISSTLTPSDLIEINNFMSVLYNNRASSYQNICDYKCCITDCDLGLNLLKDTQNEQLKLKLLFKKASALEQNEKFEDAFLVYEQLMKLDSKFKNVQINYNRVRKVLSDSGKLNKLRSNNSSNSLPQLEKKPEQQKEDTSQLYEEYKTKGNDSVKQNNYEKACEFYSKCIELDANNTLAYANRSLCFIKTNKPDLAIKDASFVLEKDKTNVKALYRRALAYKLKQDYEKVVEDLKELLKIEPNNQIAKNELSSVETLLKPKQEVKGNKVLIKEIESEEIVEQKEEPKTESKKDTLSKPKEPSVASIPKKAYDFTNISNAYEFLQAWNSITPKDIDSYGSLLSNVDPAHLHKWIGSKLDDDMLTKLIKGLCNLKNKSSLLKYDILEYLKSIGKTQRFDVIKLFLSEELKKLIAELVGSSAESSALKKLYSI